MKRSLIRLVVAIFGLLAALMELAVRIVQLAILLVERATRALDEGEARRPVAASTPPARLTLVPDLPAPPAPPDAEARLIGALTGPSLGFPVRSARAFAATVRARIATEPMDSLVREGIVHLSAAAS